MDRRRSRPSTNTFVRKRPDQDERVSPLRPQSSQDQPQQTVRCAKPSIRTGEYAQLMAQGQDLEQVSTCRQGARIHKRIRISRNSVKIERARQDSNLRPSA